jgi:hypothetical protein
MRRLTAKAIAAVPGLRALRGRGLLRPGVLVPVAVVLAVGAAALLVPHERAAQPEPAAAAKPGGETVIAKFAKAKLAKAKAQTNALFSEPTPVSRLLSMALAPMPTIAPPVEEEPNLAGLSEIPKELIWNRPPKEEEEEEGKRSSFAAFSQARENLPWDAVEPVPFSPLAEPQAAPKPGGGAKTAPVGMRGPASAPGGEVVNWLKAKVTEIKGADRSRPLYHFELWLEPPQAVKGRLVGVSYAFSTPAIRPQSQASSDRGSGFRISAGGLACADEIVLTLRFDDGRVETATVDGCKLLS